MPTYLVQWEIDVDAATPREAAEKVREIQERPHSIAHVYAVTLHGQGEATVMVDLDNEDTPIGIRGETPEAKAILERERVAIIPPDLLDKERCHKACRGWAVFARNHGEGVLMVEACDECQLMDDDRAVELANAAGIATNQYNEVTGLVEDGACPKCGGLLHQCKSGEPGCMHCNDCCWWRSPDGDSSTCGDHEGD
jgi:hypothetical protein